MSDNLLKTKRQVRGRSWFRVMMIAVVVTVAFKLVFAPAHVDTLNRVAQALILLFAGVLLGFLAYWIGYASYAPSEPVPNADRRQPAKPAGVPPPPSFPPSLGPAAPIRPVPASAPAVPPVVSSGQDRSAGDSDAVYVQALEELEQGSVVKSLWARAFAETDGDENKAKALYIRLRVQREAEDLDAQREAARRAIADQQARRVADFEALLESLRARATP